MDSHDAENIAQFLQHYQLAEDLIARKSHVELAKCARMLAMNLAQYQMAFGELPVASLAAAPAGENIQIETSEVLAAGMKELVQALSALGSSDRLPDQPEYSLH